MGIWPALVALAVQHLGLERSVEQRAAEVERTEEGKEENGGGGDGMGWAVCFSLALYDPRTTIYFASPSAFRLPPKAGTTGAPVTISVPGGTSHHIPWTDPALLMTLWRETLESSFVSYRVCKTPIPKVTPFEFGALGFDTSEEIETKALALTANIRMTTDLISASIVKRILTALWGSTAAWRVKCVTTKNASEYTLPNGSTLRPPLDHMFSQTGFLIKSVNRCSAAGSPFTTPNHAIDPRELYIDQIPGYEGATVQVLPHLKYRHYRRALHVGLVGASLHNGRRRASGKIALEVNWEVSLRDTLRPPHASLPSGPTLRVHSRTRSSAESSSQANLLNLHPDSETVSAPVARFEDSVRLQNKGLAHAVRRTANKRYPAMVINTE
ncbi:hypothetical protein DFP72DRAFT_840315 [Ephemerocybe angulata]|uniref:Uncharacterized protein n=1 Tax=Ephemerocybe angulata TaxID=980116 RepID=A0A8H6MFK8_9AGAR|nr:hypothetical protein DFP72DRAFT_840315 [Tulosesus angulatus]